MLCCFVNTASRCPTTPIPPVAARPAHSLYKSKLHILPGLPRNFAHARARPRAIRKLHLDTCDELGIEASVRAEVDRLINELQQLLIGINIMQVRDGTCRNGMGRAAWRLGPQLRCAGRLPGGGEGVMDRHDWVG